MQSIHQVNLPEEFTSYLEQNYYSKISDLSTLDLIVSNSALQRNPLNYNALYSNCSVLHAQDIANKIVQVIHQLNGLLIPAREQSRVEFMVGYGVMLAHLYDIGLKRCSPFGQAIYPEFAAQLVFTAEFDRSIDALWRENPGNVAKRLLNLSIRGLLQQNPQLVLREMLAMSMCHSTYKVPINVLNDIQALRRMMQVAVGTELHYLYHLQQTAQAEKRVAQAQQQNRPELTALREMCDRAWAELQQCIAGKTAAELLNLDVNLHYQNFEQESFAWLTSTEVEIQQLVCDVIDTLRTLCCANACLRWGATFKTSTSDEVFLN